MTDKALEAALLPCPFCGGTFVAQGASKDRISVWCSCGAEGPKVPFPEINPEPIVAIHECFRLWNRRAPLSALPGEAEVVAWRWKMLKDKTWTYDPAEWFVDKNKSDPSMVFDPLVTLASLQAMQARAERAERERDEARKIVQDIHWMAVRYADGRQSYAVGMCADALRKAYDAGWLTYSGGHPHHDLDPQYPRDGSKPEYRSVETRAEAAEARVKELEEALGQAARTFDNIRSAIETNQVVDKDAHGTAVKGRDAARTALTRTGGGSNG